MRLYDPNWDGLEALMLEELRVYNYALIDNLSVQFGPGFNVLSGETGAGKSILIDALSLALGGKGHTDAVREGSDQAEVIALIRVEESPELLEWSKTYGVDPEDNTIILRRTLKSNGRGSASVQAVPVPRKALLELAEVLVDIHGQHEHQSLFQIATHRKLLDRFAGLEERVRAFSEDFMQLTELKKRIEALNVSEGQIAREADYLRHAVDEIESAGLQEGQEEELGREQQILSRHEELILNLDMALDNAAESRQGALALLRKTREALNAAASIVPECRQLMNRLDNAFFEIEDIVEEIRKNRDESDFNPSRLAEIEEQLAKITHLQKKYGATSITEILSFADNARVQLSQAGNIEEQRRELESRKAKLQQTLLSSASQISIERSKAARILQQKIEEHLKTLGMKNARFTVDLKDKRNEEGKATIGLYGINTIEFLLSANRGETPKPLKAVASGGELSRVMLALKSVLSTLDPVPTMIFDEVDTGIGGEVARSVGEHLHHLSRRKQVFCITHLASIAVFADNHLQVVKETSGARTVTRINKVDGDARIREISRMLAGDKEDSASLDHAARLLEERNWKKS